MKKFLYVWMMAFMVLCGCGKSGQDAGLIKPDTVYFFFSNTCPHCHDALEYINQKYADTSINMVNVATPEGYKLLFACAEKFNLGEQIGTPLFCMGDNYLMGWAPEYEKRFDEYMKPFVKQ